jgi:hypothetical protein
MDSVAMVIVFDRTQALKASAKSKRFARNVSHFLPGFAGARLGCSRRFCCRIDLLEAIWSVRVSQL